MKRHRFAPRRHSIALRAVHRGLTLLEIMIVIAILGLVMGLVVVPKVMDLFGKSKEKIAKLAVDKFAFTDGPQWQMTSGGSGNGCPPDLLTIAQHTGKSLQDTIDPWDMPYRMYCKGKDTLPPGVTSGFAVLSFGEDKKEGTEDDIKSWEPLPKK